MSRAIKGIAFGLIRGAGDGVHRPRGRIVRAREGAILDLAATIVVPERVALGREDRRNGLDPQRDRDRDRPMHKVMG
ncbi:hypothetical protein M6G65_18395 [Methylobacterium tardum]|uniref:hypothetical protein n=1 Tax=Methylobacterium tardum TaxID=374432 RepID=UPI00202144ED|nr:hypothetical protein [Methylobacterium tardum]URD34570.1 hypothetical protein M6G65_18395 [Methylobacterium tardum]